MTLIFLFSLQENQLSLKCNFDEAVVLCTKTGSYAIICVPCGLCEWKTRI